MYYLFPKFDFFYVLIINDMSNYCYILYFLVKIFLLVNIYNK